MSQEVDDPHDVITRLGEWLEEKRLMKRTLADMLGCSTTTVSRVLSKRRKISQKFAHDLAVNTDINMNWLYTGQGRMERPDPASAPGTLRRVTMRLGKSSELMLEASNELHDLLNRDRYLSANDTLE